MRGGGSGTAYPYVESTMTDGGKMTDGVISGANVDLRSYSLKKQGEDEESGFFDDYYNLDSPIVLAQANVHGEY